MYRLHYSPGACSLAVHAVLREIGAAFELVDRNISAGGTQSQDYLRLNPRARVPALEIDDAVYTEAGAILVFIAERHPAANLLPPSGSPEKLRVQEWVSYLGTTIHPLYWGVWRAGRLSNDPAHHQNIARTTLQDLESRYEEINSRLKKSSWLGGETLSVADFYLYVFTRWTRRVQLPYRNWPELNAHYETMNARPSIRDALLAEGIQPI